METIAKLHIVMEYAGGGELFTKISNEGKMPEPEARAIFAQIVAAIDHMVKTPMSYPFRNIYTCIIFKYVIILLQSFK